MAQKKAVTDKLAKGAASIAIRASNRLKGLSAEVALEQTSSKRKSSKAEEPRSAPLLVAENPPVQAVELQRSNSVSSLNDTLVSAKGKSEENSEQKKILRLWGIISISRKVFKR